MAVRLLLTDIRRDRKMDPNQLLHNHQFAKLMAQHALLPTNRDNNAALIGQYAARITAWRNDAGLTDTGWPRDELPCGQVVA